jgi:hypothetical protein
MIEWVHIENEPVRPKLFSCEIRMRDGDTWPFVVSAKLAKILTEAAARWPFHVTRTREARAASLPWFEVEIGLRHLEDELTRAESSLARFLAPKLLAVLGRRSGPRMAPGGAARLKTALDRLAILLTAASKYDASGRRITKNASPAAVAIWSSVTQNPPYAEEANQLAQTICAVVESRREP